MAQPSLTRRDLLSVTAAGMAVGADCVPGHARAAPMPAGAMPPMVDITLDVNGKLLPMTLEPRVTLLDALREQAGLTGTKKGCGRGACGACTVHVNGQRVLSCLTLAARCDGKTVTTVEGLAEGGALHPVQAAFVKHDAVQCGYCIPGQIMSGIACIKEGHADTDDSIREWMSGNLCRCGAYPNIIAAIRDVTGREG